MKEKNLTIIEHIDEIRKRLMVIVVFFVVAVAGAFFVAKPLIQFLQYDGEAENITLNAFNVLDPIIIYMKVDHFHCRYCDFTYPHVSVMGIHFTGIA